MSDGRSSAADSGRESDASADEGDSSEPGGGPRRVVSDKSVDDILASLDETDATERDEAASRTRLEGDYVESAPDESPPDGATAASSPRTASETSDPADRSAAGDDAEDDVGDESSADPETGPDVDGGDSDTVPGATDSDDTQAGTDSAPEPDATESIDDTASDGDAADEQRTELADRVESGTVTGADVRVAEAGEGREETPEIDEVELTMDDLDETSGSSNAAADDAGPLAGSIDEEHSTESDEGDEESAGFLDRIRGLFSR